MTIAVAHTAASADPKKSRLTLAGFVMSSISVRWGAPTGMDEKRSAQRRFYLAYRGGVPSISPRDESRGNFGLR
jgi:hypothetical protein